MRSGENWDLRVFEAALSHDMGIGRRGVIMKGKKVQELANYIVFFSRENKVK